MKKVMAFILAMCLLSLCACSRVPETKVINEGPLEEGSYLYTILAKDVTGERPEAFHIHIDHGGAYDEAYVDDEQTVDKLVELFTKIKISSYTLEEFTDNYNSVSLIWADDTEMYISLNLKNLEIYDHETCYHYELENFEEFWKLINDLAAPVNE